MRAMLMRAAGRPLEAAVIDAPHPTGREILLRVRACAVCRTDLHILDGDLTDPKLPLVLGHQIVGIIEELGSEARDFEVGARAGIPWLGEACGGCAYCTSGRENLCDAARFTGYQIDGGFAEWTVADERFAFRLPEAFDDLQAAPLLCAGLIGYRAFRMCGDARRVGFYGFGSSAHLLAQLARHEGRELFVFTRRRDPETDARAKRLGAAWVGISGDRPPVDLDAAIVFAPAGELVPAALRAVGKGGVVVCAGIHMSDIPSFPYELLWGERTLRSVANLTRRDGEEFLAIAPAVPIRSEVERYPLERMNEALAALREGRVRGTAVVTPAEPRAD